MASYERLRNYLLCYAEDDWLDLTWVAFIIFHKPVYRPVDEVRVGVLDVIRPLVLEGLLEIGDPNVHWGEEQREGVPPCKFFPWTLPPKDALERIDREWRALNRHLDIGEICWLNLTVKGHQYVSALPPEEQPNW